MALVNPVSLTAFDWQRVADFCGAGRRRPGRAQPRAERQIISLPIVSFGAEMKPTGFVTIEKLDSRHPVLEAFKDRADLSLPRFFRYARLNPVNVEVLAGFSDGTPYLLESKSDRVIVAASGLSLADNDLPFRALFVPLMHRLLSYLSQQQLRHDLLVGDTITARVPGIGLVPVPDPGQRVA